MSGRSRIIIIVCALIACSPPPWIPSTLGAQSAASTSVTGIVARVDDIVIVGDELDRWWQAHDPVAFARIRRELFDGRKRAVDALLDERVLESEAQKRNVTVQQLLAAEVPKRITPPTDAAIKELFDQSQPAAASFEEVKSIIADYLAKQAAERARETYVQELRGSRAARTTIALVDPVADVKATAATRTRGGADASVEIVEFADFQCPFCGQLEPVMKRVIAGFGDRVRFVWKDFPLSSIHEHAEAAAVAARCAGEQGAFWQYHDLLFDNQESLSSDQLRQYARDVALDSTQFDRCVADPAATLGIRADVEEGTLRGVEGTPTVFINGETLSGALEYEAYETVIVRELARVPANR
jgi:protein-disulfide isomerase